MQIEECDSILGAMETMLGKFQGDLGNVSGEIRSLQARGLNLSRGSGVGRVWRDPQKQEVQGSDVSGEIRSLQAGGLLV